MKKGSGISRSSRPEVFIEKGVFENFARGPFLKSCMPEPATFFKKRLWHKCFSVNFTKILGIPFYWTPVGSCFWIASSEGFLKLWSKFARTIKGSLFYLLYFTHFVTFFELKMCMKCHSFILCFLFSSRFSSVYFFLSLIIVFLHDCHESVPKSKLIKNLDNSICGNFLLEKTPLLVRWFVFAQEDIFLINSRSISLYDPSYQYRII